MHMYGETYENNLMYYVRIGYSNDKKKPLVVVDGGIHAREWISHASTLVILKYLIDNINKYKEVLKKIDVIIFPVLNPDGYIYSREADRMWRGNRNLKHNKLCGVDLNRNYPFKWKNDDSHCLIYPGRHGLSEFESLYHSLFLNKNEKNIKSYISFHSFGRFILFPWTYTKKKNAKDYNDMIKLGKKMANKIKQYNNASYQVGSASKMLYKAYGTSLDYIKSLGIKYTYVIELSPPYNDQKNGFIVEDSDITTIGNEALIAFNETLFQVYSEL